MRLAAPRARESAAKPGLADPDLLSGHRPRESFDITGSGLGTIELLSGLLSGTRPDETGAYVTAGEHLFPIAVRGKSARGEPAGEQRQDLSWTWRPCR